MRSLTWYFLCLGRGVQTGMHLETGGMLGSGCRPLSQILNLIKITKFHIFKNINFSNYFNIL